MEPVDWVMGIDPAWWFVGLVLVILLPELFLTILLYAVVGGAILSFAAWLYYTGELHYADDTAQVAAIDLTWPIAYIVCAIIGAWVAVFDF